jgi:hypothetical protein
VDLIAELANAFADVVDFFPGGVWPHRNNHGSSKKQKAHSHEWAGLQKVVSANATLPAEPVGKRAGEAVQH